MHSVRMLLQSWEIWRVQAGNAPTGTPLHAGMDFASFGADLGAAQAAALQFYSKQGAADAAQRAVQATTSVGTLLNGAGRSPRTPHCETFYF